MSNIIQIESGKDFWSLMDEMLEDEKRFILYRDFIVEAFREGCLFSLCANDEKKDSYAKNSETENLLPCFCIVAENTCMLLWVHKRIRRKGYGTVLIQKLGITKVSPILPDSMPFWKSLSLQ